MHFFIGWTDIDGEMSQEKLSIKLNELVSVLELNFILQGLANIAHVIFKDGYTDEILRNMYLSDRLLHVIQKYEQRNGAGFIFHKQALLIIEQIVVNTNIEKSTPIGTNSEIIGKLFLFTNSLINKIDYPLNESIGGANVVMRRSLDILHNPIFVPVSASYYP